MGHIGRLGGDRGRQGYGGQRWIGRRPLKDAWAQKVRLPGFVCLFVYLLHERFFSIQFFSVDKAEGSRRDVAQTSSCRILATKTSFPITKMADVHLFPAFEQQLIIFPSCSSGPSFFTFLKRNNLDNNFLILFVFVFVFGAPKPTSTELINI